jgi:RNA-directed DNA polymerase
MDDEVSRASSGRPTNTSADSEMVESWGNGGCQWSETKTGTPRGQWFHRCSLTRICITSSICRWRLDARKWPPATVRCADDLVLGFQYRTDAERFLQQFRERLVRFGLELHPDKTRLIEFGRFAAQNRKQRGEGKPETFVFLGFTHYGGHLRSSGAFNVWRITATKRKHHRIAESESGCGRS